MVVINRIRAIYAAVLCVLLLFSGCNRSEKSTSYKNYSEAQKSGDIERGWLPDFLPNSATQIIESHNVEINAMRVEFKFKRNDLDFLKQFNEASDSEKTKIIDRIKRGGWSRLGSSGNLRAFSRKDKALDGYLVLDSKNEVAQYWEEP